MMDLGLLYPFETGQLRGLSLAAAFRNLGPKIKYDVENASLPQTTVLGAGYLLLGGNLVLDLDYIQPRDNSSYLAAGVEYKVFDILRLRAGLNNKSDFIGNGISYGMGLRFNQWNLDYAFVPYGDFGGTSRVSVGIRFGRALQVTDAGDQVEMAFRKAEGLDAAGKSLQAYSMLSDLLQIAPWHQPSVDLKARIEKRFNEMSASKDKAQLDAQIADAFTAAKAAFDRDELVEAKKGFDTILRLQPGHIGSTIYLERIKNRYASLAQESFKEGMAYYAAGDYQKAKLAFEKTLTIDPWHADAKAQLETTKQMIEDSTRREQEMKRLASAAGAYREGLDAFQKNDFETALKKFEEVQTLSPEYEEVGRYMTVTKKSLGGILFEQSQVNMENGQYEEAVTKLKRASDLMPEDARVKPALEAAIRERDTKNAEESKRLYQEGLEAYLGGNTEKAEKNWKRALELDSTNDDALKALSKLEEQKSHENPNKDQH
jgi:tetratricopeptide (TPR) repeat protein